MESEPVVVDAFPVRVLGGVFHVSQVLVPPQGSGADAIAFIHSVPPDRWFVMVSEHDGSASDALAMVDDQLDLQICAHGVLSND